MTAEPDRAGSSGSESLQLLIGGGSGEPEVLLVMERLASDGMVQIRSWTSADWSSPPTSTVREAPALLREIERWERAGRSLSQPLALVRRWLERS